MVLLKPQDKQRSGEKLTPVDFLQKQAERHVAAYNRLA
jgi:hypothetical protein